MDVPLRQFINKNNSSGNKSPFSRNSQKCVRNNQRSAWNNNGVNTKACFTLGKRKAQHRFRPFFTAKREPMLLQLMHITLRESASLELNTPPTYVYT
jgi:hypothetical protein